MIKSNFYYDIYLNKHLVKRYLSGANAEKKVLVLRAFFPHSRITMLKIKRQKLSTEKKVRNSMCYSKIKKKNNDLYTGVIHSSPHIVNYSSPHKNKIYIKNTRVNRARARENRKSQFGVFSSAPNPAVGDHATFTQFFSGAVQERGKSTNTGGRSCSVINAFQKKQGNFENHGKFKKTPLIQPVFDKPCHDIVYLPSLQHMHKWCSLGNWKDWADYFRR